MHLFLWGIILSRAYRVSRGALGIIGFVTHNSGSTSKVTAAAGGGYLSTLLKCGVNGAVCCCVLQGVV